MTQKLTKVYEAYVVYGAGPVGVAEFGRRIKASLDDPDNLMHLWWAAMSNALPLPCTYDVFYAAYSYGWTHNIETRNLRLKLQQLVGGDKPFDERDWL